MHTLYKLTFESGKSYIGQTVRTMNTRIAQHKRSAMNGGSPLPVHCAWRKHGAPSIEIIGEFETHEELHKAEIDAIANHNTLAPHGYNVCLGGETAPSKSPSVAAKISAKAIGRKATAETIAILSSSSKSSWESPEYREKVSSGLKSAWTDDMRKAAGERSKARWEKRKAEGWVMPESQKKKLSDCIVTQETRQKMSAAAKGKKKAPRTDATRKKLSLSVAASWKDPEINEKRSAAISSALKEKYANMSEEDKLEFSELRKRAWETRRLKTKQIPEE